LQFLFKKRTNNKRQNRSQENLGAACLAVLILYTTTMLINSKNIIQIDHRLTRWMADKGILFLRLSVGIVFLWFGFLKFFPDLSPASDLATRTISLLSFGFVGPELAMPILAVWETLIGVGLIFRLFLRETLLLLFLQMIGTITPIFIFPSETFTHYPYVPTLEGQYIIKNLVVISAGIVIGATVRGGSLVAEPQ
jgi:uncharacterized membrane protein YphA (DoxX/SURF4 family)